MKITRTITSTVIKAVAVNKATTEAEAVTLAIPDKLNEKAARKFLATQESITHGYVFCTLAYDQKKIALELTPEMLAENEVSTTK